MAMLQGSLIKDWGCSMSPQGSAFIWIFIELTLAFRTTVYKRMPIGFYLVACNKPQCLTCKWLHRIQQYTCTPLLYLPLLSLNYPNMSVCLNYLVGFSFLWQLFGFISPGLKQRLADFVFFHACSMIVYSFCIMKYLISCRGMRRVFPGLKWGGGGSSWY